jgi:hypothetical protein
MAMPIILFLELPVAKVPKMGARKYKAWKRFLHLINSKLIPNIHNIFLYFIVMNRAIFYTPIQITVLKHLKDHFEDERKW